MKKDILQKIISDKIQEVTLEYIRDLKSQRQAQATDDYMNSKSISEDEVDALMFYGGNVPKKEEKRKAQITIQENVDTSLKITTSEIKNFENSFKEILDNIPGASIVFDKQKNGYSIAATKRPDGVEAKASGILNLGDNGKLIWSYSILNGFNLNAQNLKLSQSNKGMFEALANHYDDWQKEWREKLNLPTAPEANPSETAPVATGQEPVAGANFGAENTGAAATPEAAPAPAPAA